MRLLAFLFLLLLGCCLPSTGNHGGGEKTSSMEASVLQDFAARVPQEDGQCATTSPLLSLFSVCMSHDLVGVLHGIRNQDNPFLNGEFWCSPSSMPLPWPMHLRSIPRKFNKYIGRKHSTVATILSPLGNSWQVQVHGDDNYMYFGEGWEEFCQAHNLCVGCLLVFSYEDEMVFRVTVFDPSTCMKEYPAVVEDINQMDNKTRGGSTSLDEMEVMGSAESQEHSHEQQADGRIEPTASQEQTPSNIGTSMKDKFQITMNSHCLHRPYLHIARGCRRINGISKRKKVILRDPKMRLWPVSVYHHHKGKKNMCRFGSGWDKFFSSNYLEEGDVCIFKTLPEEENFTIHVSILKKHMVPGVSDLHPWQEELCPVVRKSFGKDTTAEVKLEDG